MMDLMSHFYRCEKRNANAMILRSCLYYKSRAEGNVEAICPPWSSSVCGVKTTLGLLHNNLTCLCLFLSHLLCNPSCKILCYADCFEFLKCLSKQYWKLKLLQDFCGILSKRMSGLEAQKVSLAMFCFSLS